MFRAALHRGVQAKSLLPFTAANVRRQSTSFPSSSSSSTKTGIGIAIAALLGSGGLYGYYKYDQLQDQMHKDKMNQDSINKKVKQLQQLLEDAKLSEKLAMERLTHLESEKESEKTIKDSEGEKIGLEARETGEKEDINVIDLNIDADVKASVEEKYKKMIKKVRDELEEELRHHLKRQLSAHHDHLHEQLKMLTRELERKHQITLEDSVLMERTRYQSDLSDSLHRLQTLEGILKVRDQLDKDERTAKELWLASQSLIDALKHRTSDISGEVKPKQLTKEISVVKETLLEYSNKNELASLALESISQDAIAKGVYSEDDLIHRFDKIERTCRRVALIGDEGASLFRYLISYLQSMLVLSHSKIPQQELVDEQVIDTSKWDTFDILARVKHALKFHNLEMALRYANQLSGEPRKVAKDWINDARIHLEIRQAANIILSQAASISAQVLK